MIYLDNNSTTQLDPAVLAAMEPFFHNLTGNPSSVHSYGQKAKGILGEALKRCARYFKVHPDEIIFTSGATEALNGLIRCIPKGSHVITSALEHAAVLEPLKLADCEVSYLYPSAAGVGAVTPLQVEEALRPSTRLIVLTMANNETGIKTEIASIAALAHRMSIPLVLDGVAALGKDSFTLPEGVWAVCLSAHKIHGPLGIGLTVLRKTYKAYPWIVGGGQQQSLRAGTENLPAIVGFAKALDLLDKHAQTWIPQMQVLRDRFESGLKALIPDLIIHGQNQPRICNTSQIAFPGINGETLLMRLDLEGLAASHGAACSAGALEPSRVLLNMGISPQLARSSLRFSLSRFTTLSEIETALLLIHKTVNSRSMIAEKKVAASA
jgi:cysteine desulfurase